MPTLLDSRIPKHAWLDKANGQEKANSASGVPANCKGPFAEAARAAHWETVIDELVAMRGLSDNWDGLGAMAPTPEMLACAIGLADVLQEQGVDPPTRVVPASDGTLHLEWQFPDGSYGEVELVRPFHGEVMLAKPGKPPQHWTIPNA